MTIWLVAAIPVLIMFFALAMERLENRLRHLAARENGTVEEREVEEFLLAAGSSEEPALVDSGVERALELFRRRGPRRTTMVHSRRIGQRS